MAAVFTKQSSHARLWLFESSLKGEAEGGASNNVPAHLLKREQMEIFHLFFANGK
jgi:hypothetical protein